MHKRSHLSLLLLGLSMLNPLCCCLGDALSAIPASPVTSKDSCCEGGNSIPDSENIPNQECPCECEEFLNQHKEIWLQERLLDEPNYSSFILPEKFSSLVCNSRFVEGISNLNNATDPPVWQLFRVCRL